MYSTNIVFESYKIYNGTKSYRKTSFLIREKFNCNITRQTIMIWIKKIKVNITELIKRRTDTNYIIDNTKNQTKLEIDILNDINKIVYNEPFVTRKNLIEAIKIKHNVTLSLNNVSKIFKKLNLTRKKPKYHVIKSIEYLDKLIETRNEFKKSISKIDMDKIISIDESSFNNLNTNNMGLSEKGKRINIPANEKRIKNNSLICAVSVDKIMYYEIHETSVNSDIFYNYMNNLIKINKLKGYYFMIDNVRFHHCKKTLELIVKSGNHYLFTPPYSPNNNPIETIFGMIKSKFKQITKNGNKDKIKTKPLIIISINKTIETTEINKNKNYKDIFMRSIRYDYKDIEKELRDRLIIKKIIF